MDIKHLYLEDGTVNPELFSEKFIIWGTGGDSAKLWECLPREAKEKVVCFCDSDVQKAGQEIYGKNIRHIETINNLTFSNVALAFNAWPEVAGKVTSWEREIFADFRYEHESTGGGHSCIVCGGNCTESKAHYESFIAEREFLGNPPETKLFTCKICGMSYSSYRPSDAEMDRLYAGYRDENYCIMRQKYEPQYTWTENSRYMTEEYITLRKNRLQDFIYEEAQGVKTVLDYGGDRGQFIPDVFENSLKYVFDISGTNPGANVESIRNLDELLCRKFDFVMCCHLLEHVSNPVDIVANMTRCTMQGGYIYVEVPYETKFMRYSDYAFHEHINFFTEKTLVALGERLGLHVVKRDILGGSVLRFLYQV